jgi:hypothetical protein
MNKHLKKPLEKPIIQKSFSKINNQKSNIKPPSKNLIPNNLIHLKKNNSYQIKKSYKVNKKLLIKLTEKSMTKEKPLKTGKAPPLTKKKNI